MRDEYGKWIYGNCPTVVLIRKIILLVATRGAGADLAKCVLSTSFLILHDLIPIQLEAQKNFLGFR